MANITKALMGTIRADLNSALEAVAKKHGVLISLGNGSYSADGLTGGFKLDLAAQGADSAPGEMPAHVKARKDWKDYAGAYGLEESWLGKCFQRTGCECTIIGMMPKRVKYPVFIRETRVGVSREILLTVEEVKMRMGATERAAAAKK